MQVHAGALTLRYSADNNAPAAERVLAQLFQSPAYLSARSISCYLSLPHSEIQTDALIRHALENGKRIYVPYCPKEDKTVMRMVRLNSLEHFQRLNVNRWGIREVDPDEVSEGKARSALIILH